MLDFFTYSGIKYNLIFLFQVYLRQTAGINSQNSRDGVQCSEDYYSEQIWKVVIVTCDSRFEKGRKNNYQSNPSLFLMLICKENLYLDCLYPDAF